MEKHYRNRINHDEMTRIVGDGGRERLARISPDNLTMDIWEEVDGKFQVVEQYITESGIYHEYRTGWKATPMDEQNAEMGKVWCKDCDGFYLPHEH